MRQLLNRVSLVGRLETELRILRTNGSQESIAFVLGTEFLNYGQRDPNSRQYHQVAIEDPLAVAYARTYLNQGDLVFIEGRLESIPGKDSWVVVEEGQGLIHPLITGHENKPHPSATPPVEDETPPEHS